MDQVVVVADGRGEPAGIRRGPGVVPLFIEERGVDRLEDGVAVQVGAHLHEVIHFLKLRARGTTEVRRDVRGIRQRDTELPVLKVLVDRQNHGAARAADIKIALSVDCVSELPIRALEGARTWRDLDTALKHLAVYCDEVRTLCVFDPVVAIAGRVDIDIVPFPAIEHVIALPAKEHIIPFFAEDQVIVCGSHQAIGALGIVLADQHVAIDGLALTEVHDESVLCRKDLLFDQRTLRSRIGRTKDSLICFNAPAFQWQVSILGIHPQHFFGFKIGVRAITDPI